MCMYNCAIADSATVWELLHNYSTVQLLNCATESLFSCATVQLSHCETVQLCNRVLIFLCNSSTVQPCTYFLVQQFNCATAQLCNCATAQLRNCATAQLCNCATVQLRNCATVRLCDSDAIFYTILHVLSRLAFRGLKSWNFSDPCPSAAVFSWSGRQRCRFGAFRRSFLGRFSKVQSKVDFRAEVWLFKKMQL